MANPQKENGYTAIANELMDAFARTRINGEAMQVLMVILRKTYGYNKKSDRIALSQFVEATGLKKQNVIRAVKKVVSLGLVIQKDNAGIKEYCFTKNYALWRPLSKKITVIKKDNDVIQKDNKSNPKRVLQKTKVDITKDIDTAQSAEVVEFINLFKLINPSYQTLFGHPPSRKAAERLLKLHDLDYWRRFMVGYQGALEERYCPRATTPIVFEKKLGDIEVYGRQRKAEKIKKNNSILI